MKKWVESLKHIILSIALLKWLQNAIIQILHILRERQKSELLGIIGAVVVIGFVFVIIIYNNLVAYKTARSTPLHKLTFNLNAVDVALNLRIFAFTFALSCVMIMGKSMLQVISKNQKHQALMIIRA